MESKQAETSPHDPRIEEAMEGWTASDPASSRMLLDQVIAERSPGYARAAISRALNMESAGEMTEAECLYRVAIDAGDPEDSPAASINLGILLREEHKHEEARHAFYQALNSGHPDHAPAALNNLAYLHELEGNLTAAIEGYQRTIQTEHPWHSAWGRVNLGRVLEARGDRLAAADLYRYLLKNGPKQVLDDARDGLSRTTSVE